ncbi:uncharacterized protein LOC141629967 [Silene latifolia]|uniref:uncharacterized protein LOC141629967 n=1 Tax=Silene latifolia TaxID=37657 RepID=UPI003D76F173
MLGCWAIWEARNKWIFENVQAREEGVVRRVRELGAELQNQNDCFRGGGCNNGEEDDRGKGKLFVERVGGGETYTQRGWMRPPEGMVKINVDAGVKEGVGTGLGAVCRDEHGEVLWCVTSQCREVSDPSSAEAMAILLGLEEARRRGCAHIMMESDCFNVVEALKQRKKGRSDLYLILDDILHLCSSFRFVEWSFVRRAFNLVAHELAHVESR